MLSPRSHTIPVSSPITANGIIATGLQNLGASASPTVVLLLTVATGSGPLILNLLAGMDGTNYALVGSSASITGPGTYRIVFQNVLESQLQVAATASGSTTVSSLQVLMSSPSA